MVPFFFTVWGDQIARFCIGPNGKSSYLITPDHEKEQHLCLVLKPHPAGGMTCAMERNVVLRQELVFGQLCSSLVVVATNQT